MKSRIQLVFLFVVLIASDQFLKLLFSENSVCNKNLAGSIPIASGVFYFFWLIIFFPLVYYFLKSKNYSEKVSLIFVISGAISNSADRLFHGCVIDFIDLKIWPVFNLADIYITIGAIILLVNLIKKPKPQSGLPNF